jgi:hypothetical protein
MGFTNHVDVQGAQRHSSRAAGFNWKPTDRLVVRGGVGIFSGGTPDVFLSNVASPTRASCRTAIDIQRNATAAGCNIRRDRATVCNDALFGVSGTISSRHRSSRIVTTNTASLVSAAPTERDRSRSEARAPAQGVACRRTMKQISGRWAMAGCWGLQFLYAKNVRGYHLD